MADLIDVLTEKLRNTAQNVGPALANANYAGAPDQFMAGLQTLGGRYNAGLRRIGGPVESTLMNALTPQPAAPPTVDELRNQPNFVDLLRGYLTK